MYVGAHAYMVKHTHSHTPVLKEVNVTVMAVAKLGAISQAQLEFAK
jgi:hypothetical protein